MENNIEKIIQEYKEYAEKKAISLNPDKKIVESIIKGLLIKEKELDQRYCPCRRTTNNLEEDKKIICPCVYHLDEIKKDGHCLCRLFVKKVQ